MKEMKKPKFVCSICKDKITIFESHTSILKKGKVIDFHTDCYERKGK